MRDMGSKMKKQQMDVCNCSIIIFFVITVYFSGCISEKPVPHEQDNSGIVVEDALGNTLSFQTPPERIAVAGADIATVLLMIGAKDQVIGVGESIKKDTQINPYYRNRESLGESSTINPEKAGIAKT